MFDNKTATWPLKTLEKIKQKSTKNLKFSTIFGGFRGRNDWSYQICRRPRNMNKLDLNI